MGIRKVQVSDWTDIKTIYQLGIDTKVATFETSPPKDYIQWIKKTDSDNAFVFEDGNCVLGWVILSKVSSRCVYEGVGEISIYVHPDHKRDQIGSKLYKHLEENDLPNSECLADTVDRFLPYWHNQIKEDILNNKKVLIVAHGNSLRALVKYLNNISDEKILKYNIPTGAPLVFELDKNLKPIKDYYLGDQDMIAEKMASVENQGKAK